MGSEGSERRRPLEVGAGALGAPGRGQHAVGGEEGHVAQRRELAGGRHGLQQRQGQRGARPPQEGASRDRGSEGPHGFRRDVNAGLPTIPRMSEENR